MWTKNLELAWISGVASLCLAGLAFDWFEERLEAQTLLDASATKYVPPHVGLFYCFGGLVLMALLVQQAFSGAGSGWHKR